MPIAADISCDISGNFRWTGAAATTYSVLEFHRYIGALQDDAQASGDDLLDITSSTASVRSTDQILALNSPFNIDDTLAEHLYDGSISQNGGDDLYSGLEVVGTVESGTEPVVLQDDMILPAYWGTGINGVPAALIVMRILVKSRSGGADIDGKRIKVLARELGDTTVEFPVTLGQANSVGAISSVDDINNNTADATILGWTISNTEGLRLLDIDGNGTPEDYYSEWDKLAQSLNDVFEYTKAIQQRAHIADNGTDTGTDYTVDNATIVGQGQEFSARSIDEKLVEMRFRLKIGAGTPTGLINAELMLSDDAGSGNAEPTGGVLATSKDVLASRLTSTYAEFIFRFNDNYTLTADEKYFAIIRHPDGAVGDYIEVEGAAAGADDGNLATEDPASTWTAVPAADLWFTVKSSPVMHGRAGELMRGIDYEVYYDSESGGPFTQNEIVFWGTVIDYDGLGGGPFEVGEYVKFIDDGTSDVINGGKILKNSGTQLWVALDFLTQNLSDEDDIVGLTSGATANINATIVDDDLGGGEGVLLAFDDNGVDGELYLQLISGVAPVNTLPIEGRTSSATCAVATTVNSRPISPAFVGVSTGTNIIGAYGIGFDVNDIGSSDKFTDLSNTLRIPPNNVTMTVTGLVATEDRVLCGPRAAGIMEKDQMALATTLNGAGETSVVVDAIPTETPAEGTSSNSRIRVQNDDGIYRRQDYTSHDGVDTFTIPSTAYNGAQGTPTYQASSGNDVFVAYIDVLADAGTEAFTAVYTSDRALLLRVRDGGGTPIVTIENPVTFGGTSFSTAIVRQPDV
jgi:hypothetical protein